MKPSHSKFRLHCQVFSLGDRVVSTFDEGPIPLGLKGTVVGIESDFLQVLFDKTFLGGTDLDGRCSLYRGFVVANDTVLNLSHQQPPISGNVRSARTRNRNSNESFNSRPTKNAWQENNHAEKQKLYSGAKDVMKNTLGVNDVKKPTYNQPRQSNSSGMKIQITRKESASNPDEKSIRGGSPQLLPSQEEQIAANLKRMLNIKPTQNNANEYQNSPQNDTTRYMYSNIPNNGQYVSTGNTYAHRSNQGQYYTTGGVSAQNESINGTDGNQALGNFHVLNQIVRNLQGPVASSYPNLTSQNNSVSAQSSTDDKAESSSSTRGKNRSRGQHRGRRPWGKRGHH